MGLITLDHSFLSRKSGMATGRVQTGSLHIQIRSTGQGPRPGPYPFTKQIFSQGPDSPRRAPRASLSPSRKKAYFKQAPNSTSNPRPNMKSQKSLLFKSPQPRPNNNNNKKSHFSILKPRNNQTNGGYFGSNKK